MKRIILFITLCCLGFSCYASQCKPLGALFTVGKDPKIEKSGFCTKFPEVAQCYCLEHTNGRQAFCSSMQVIYNGMKIKHRNNTIEGNCADQKDTDVSTCILQWSCFVKGKKNGNPNAASCFSDNTPCPGAPS